MSVDYKQVIELEEQDYKTLTFLMPAVDFSKSIKDNLLTTKLCSALSTLHYELQQKDLLTQLVFFPPLLGKFLSLGADPQGDYYQIPLINACKNSLVASVKLLLSYEAEPNVSDDDDRTPLHYAHIHHNQEIIDLLLAAGARPNAKDCDSRIPSSYN